MNNQI